MKLFRKSKKNNADTEAASVNAQGQGSEAEVRESWGLFVLNDVPAQISNAFDIVAVHGLGGDWEKTWTSANGKLWLRDFLPTQMEQVGAAARIMSFGYDSNSFFGKSTSDINDVAGMLIDYLDALRQSEEERRRPIIFVAHSLGGIVTKRAICLCHERQSLYGPILTCIRGVLFFAVPHRGADIAYWGLFLQQLLYYSQLTLRGNDEFLKGLQRNSKLFASISQQFIERAQSLHIVTFVESERLGNQLIVERSSAELMLPNEKVVTIPGANHRTICKFDTASSQKYIPAWNSLRTIAKDSRKDEAKDAAAHDIIHDLDAQSNNEIEKLLQLLFLTDPKDDVAAISRGRGQRHPGTCEWILRRNEYLSWAENDETPFWAVTGSPGIGKTTLARYILENLQAGVGKADSDCIILYYFFDNQIEDRRAALALLRSLTWQLTCRRRELWTIISEDFKIKKENLLTFDTLWRHFQRMIGSLKATTIYILIDALDECDEASREMVLQALSETANNPQTRHKWLVTARPDMEIEQALGHAWLTLRVDSGLVNIDLLNFIESKVEDLTKRRCIPQSLSNDVKAAVSEHADGTFLWASFVLQELAHTPTHKMREALQQLPRGLYQTYSRILRRIAHKNRRDTKIILRWITTASTTLTTTELALAFGTETRYWQQIDSPSEEEIVECSSVHLCCESLVYTDSKTGEVRLVHQTVKDFLLGPRLGNEADISEFRIGLDEANFEIFNICLRYLSWPAFRHNFDQATCSDSRKEIRKSNDILKTTTAPQNSLVRYAMDNWRAHAYAAALKAFQWSDLNLVPNLRDNWLLDSIKKECVEIVCCLLEHGADIASCDNEGNGTLHYAANSGNFSIVRALIRAGAQLNMRNNTGVTPVFLAATANKTDSFFLLLSYGAKADIYADVRICQGVPNVASKAVANDDVFQGDNSMPNIDFIKSHLHDEGRLSPSQAISILTRARQIMQKEPNCLQLKSPIVIIGMLFGQFYDLLQFFEKGGDPGNTQYLFLGNYINRGDFSTEVMLLLLALKIRHPNTFWLLRGPHECRLLTDYFSFRTECRAKYSEEVWETFLQTFNAMPLAGILDERYFCAAGGIGPDLINMQDLENIDRFHETPDTGNACDVLWSQYDYENECDDSNGKFFTHHRQGKSHYYSYKAVVRFLDANNLLSLITSSTKCDAGYQILEKTKAGFPSVINISSIPNYLDVYNNRGGIIKLANNNFSIYQFKAAEHPYFLPNFLDVFQWSMPFIIEKACDLWGIVVSEVNKQGPSKWLLPDSGEQADEPENGDKELDLTDLSAFEQQFRSVFHRNCVLSGHPTLLQILFSLSIAEKTEGQN